MQTANAQGGAGGPAKSDDGTVAEESGPISKPGEQKAVKRRRKDKQATGKAGDKPKPDADTTEGDVTPAEAPTASSSEEGADTGAGSSAALGGSGTEEEEGPVADMNPSVKRKKKKQRMQQLAGEERLAAHPKNSGATETGEGPRKKEGKAKVRSGVAAEMVDRAPGLEGRGDAPVANANASGAGLSTPAPVGIAAAAFAQDAGGQGPAGDGNTPIDLSGPDSVAKAAALDDDDDDVVIIIEDSDCGSQGARGGEEAQEDEQADEEEEEAGPSDFIPFGVSSVPRVAAAAASSGSSAAERSKTGSLAAAPGSADALADAASIAALGQQPYWMRWCNAIDSPLLRLHQGEPHGS